MRKSFFKIIYHHVYLLQLENYHVRRFLHVVVRGMGKRHNEPRQGITWTIKLKLLFFLGLSLQVATAFALPWIVITFAPQAVSLTLVSFTGAFSTILILGARNNGKVRMWHLLLHACAK